MLWDWQVRPSDRLVKRSEPIADVRAAITVGARDGDDPVDYDARNALENSILGREKRYCLSSNPGRQRYLSQSAQAHSRRISNLSGILRWSQSSRGRRGSDRTNRNAGVPRCRRNLRQRSFREAAVKDLQLPIG